MSQRSVEKILGRLVTDEAFRRHYWERPAAVLDELVASGAELNDCERRALRALRRDAVDRFAAALDPCIQKADWCAGEPSASSSARRGRSIE
jgi:hypothetical protein